MGKHITNFVIYIKREKRKKKRGEKVVGFSKIGFFLGGSTVNKIISFTFNGWD